MYEIIKNVILSGIYELSSMLVKIDTIWIQGKLTEEERTELIQLSRDHADYTVSLDLMAHVDDLEKRVRKLEEANSDPEPEPEIYPEYVPGKWYYAGDKITFKEESYECIAPEGQVCTWNPEEYPAYWNKIS